MRRRRAGALPLLTRIVGRPEARILVRLDADFAAPELFEFLDEVEVDYVVGMAKNAVLEQLSALAMWVAEARSEESGENVLLRKGSASRFRVDFPR